MIPPDVASSLRMIVPDQKSAVNAQNNPIAPAQRVADVLSDLVPGQRVLAEIQALLPNGSYRAIVAQRDITLALPFSAKAGDSLELEVVETDGKIALAFIANKSTGEQAGKPTDSVATTLSQTGKLIGDLMGNIGDPGKRASPAPLNGNLPLVEKFPDHAANLAPILQDALTKSGVFYEAHQARWVAGELPTEALKQEPQGKLSSTPSTAAVNANLEAKSTDASAAAAALANSAATTRTEQLAQSNQGATPANTIPRDLVPIIQQQLDALATQNYAWQGQIWPGQQMQWEIGENTDGGRSADSDAISRWQTRLKLSLPSLGGIDAVLRLSPGGEVNISMTASSESGEARLRESAPLLGKQLESAGLNLTQFLVRHGETAE